MSATLSVLHVLMAGGPAGVGGAGGRLIIPGAGDLPPLDPILMDFWSSFPCPPPWNRALLFRVNWTACVGQALGHRLQWLLADRCNIPHDVLDLDLDIDLDLLPLPRDIPGVGQGDEIGAEGAGEEEVDGEGGELEVPSECDASCVAMIALACLVFSLLLAILVFCVCRNRSKASSPSHQSSLSAYQDNAKFYNSCHYASAPVLPRPLETRLHGSHTETRVVKGSSSPYQHHHDHPHHDHPHHDHPHHDDHHHHHHTPSPYHQHSPFHHHQQHFDHHHQHYEQHPLVTPKHTTTHNRGSRRSHHHHHHHHPDHHHTHAHFNPIVTLPAADDSPSTATPKSAEPPPKLSATGAGILDTAAVAGYLSSSSASQTYSQTCSERSHTYESIGDVHFSGSVSSGMDKVAPGAGFRLYAQGHPPPGRPSACRVDLGPGGANEPSSGKKRGTRQDGTLGGGGFDSQTLPVRHLRRGDAAGSKGDAEVEECPYAAQRQSTVSSGSRRRLSSSSHQSECSGGYQDGGGGAGRRRSIPALHPNYFDRDES
ncbi:hypothetical protein ACOMHN_035109 [Nucella lapillus]